MAWRRPITHGVELEKNDARREFEVQPVEPYARLRQLLAFAGAVEPENAAILERVIASLNDEQRFMLNAIRPVGL